MANASNTNFSFNAHEDITAYMEYRTGELMWQIVPPILITLGTVGNCLSILVLTRKCIRSSTTALFLTVLAFSDLFVLYTGLLRQWLIHLFGVDVRTLSEFGCKLNIWLVYSSLDFSAWILIVVTLERVISAWVPHRAKSLCTKQSAVALLVGVIVFIFLLNAHLLYGMVFRYSNTVHKYSKCVEINANYRDFFNVTWPWIDLCIFCLIPFTVIVIGNTLILFKVLKSQRKVKSRIVPSAQNGNRQAATSGHSNKQSSMTAMLFTLNVVFLLSTSPISIYNIGYPYWSENATLHKQAKLDLWWAIVNMLMYFNNSLNFLLYCLSGTKFRQEVIRIFCSWRIGDNLSNMNLAAHSNYTRTRFETPSATPSPRHSAIFTVNNSLSNSNDQLKTNVEMPNSSNRTGVTFSRLSNNSLHPDDALKIANDLSHRSKKGMKIEDKETQCLNGSDLYDKSSNSISKSIESEKENTQVPNGRHSVNTNSVDVDKSPVCQTTVMHTVPSSDEVSDTKENRDHVHTQENSLQIFNKPQNDSTV